MSKSDSLQFLEKSAVTVAKELIGWRLYVKQTDNTLVGGTIIETEAYTQVDAASHSYRGETKRTSTMFGPPGHIYVYFTYGMHYCMNIVTGKTGSGQAVLLRSLQLDKGVAIARQRRGFVADNQLTNGPAKICQALSVNMHDNGSLINDSRFILKPPIVPVSSVATTRIGITKDRHRLWRFVAADS